MSTSTTAAAMADGATRKLYHRGAKIDQKGNVSALCYARPRAINLARESWTITDSAVTCPKCLAISGASK